MYPSFDTNILFPGACLTRLHTPNKFDYHAHNRPSLLLKKRVCRRRGLGSARISGRVRCLTLNECLLLVDMTRWCRAVIGMFRDHLPVWRKRRRRRRRVVIAIRCVPAYFHVRLCSGTRGFSGVSYSLLEDMRASPPLIDVRM